MTADSMATVSVRGSRRSIPAVSVGPNTRVLIKGSVLRLGEIHDEFWLATKDLPDLGEAIKALRRRWPPADLFTFAQKIPDVAPRYSYYREWDNVAVACFDSYGEWFDNQINRSVRKHIRKAAKEGVVAEAVPYTDQLVSGICEIYNEVAIRQGRAFWHFGKTFETVKSENGTYPGRSVFIGAYHCDELVGFLKFVRDGEVALIMQILSKTAHFERRPTNALLAKAVEICEASRVRYLTYGKYVYGSKDGSTLVDFKRNNGFAKVDVPRYYVPLTLKGRVALKLGLHRNVETLVPAAVGAFAVGLRRRWHGLRRKSG